MTYEERYPYLVREPDRGPSLGRRYLADPDACDSAWCYDREHAQHYTREEATRRAEQLDAVVEHVESHLRSTE